MSSILLRAMLFSVLLLPLQLMGQTEPEESLVTPHSIAAKILFNDYALPNGFDGDSLSLSNGLEFDYIRNINPYLNIAIPLKVGLANVSGFRNKRTIFSADVVLQIQYFREEAFFVPYVFGGGGVVSENFEMTNVQFPVGLGFNFRIGDKSYLNLQGEYRFSEADNRNNLQYGVGYVFRLGKRSLEEQLALDSDGDTVPDVEDQCPDVAGLPGLLGCPDADGDGIADVHDECPDEPGTQPTLGCPDKDEDGVRDSDDQCPDEAGLASNNGCPKDEDEEEEEKEKEMGAALDTDRDNDGITDAMDECPDEAGPATNKGCPVGDRDGDGVPDDEDDCPNMAGPISKKGCPTVDSDGDGIVDEQDACPDMAGPLVLEGCPDTDGDGIVDKNDDCPNIPGAAATRGCPNTDSDNDGVLDHLDNCPYQAGPVASGGCPDSDGDGILDSMDECPYQPGPADRKGCPFIDNDGDGIEDKYDNCPYQAGPVASGGCPDRDGDGVPDAEDSCPDLAGPFNGCPDTDADGTDDSQDACPTTPGPKSNYGCPEIKVEEKRVIEEAAQAVVFEVGKATLKAESYAVLDQVADILLRYPDYKVMVTGHTDNTGRSTNNQILSEERAKSCYEYLVSKGINRSRMDFNGKGEVEPIATNSTEEGRELNRRVEFNLYVR